MEIRIDRASAVPVYQQIRAGIREQILSGRLPDGYRLPPERKLADALGVNRSTVLAAYRELKAEGMLDAHVGRGTTVTGRPEAPEPPASATQLPWRQLFRAGAAREHDPLLRNVLELTERRDVISLSAGLPAPELFPLQTLAAIAEDALSRDGSGALLHSPTEGLTSFREALAQLTTSRGIATGAPEVLVLSGSQQGLDLVARTFLDPGDPVVVEEPSYFGALEAFRSSQARLLGVPCDEEGMRTDLLASLLSRHRPKLIYTLPTFQNPSGAVMSLARRQQLLDLSIRHQVPILEDDSYSDLRYDGEPLPALAALDPGEHVLYLSSLSKVLFPGLRLGWLRAPRPVVRQLALVKQAIDLHSGTLAQRLIERFLREGHFARHVATLRSEYAQRRDALLSSLGAVAPEGFSWERPAGGFYVWVRVPEAISPARLLSEAARERVTYLPGAACYVSEPPEGRLRLNFTFHTPDRLREGVERLARALASAASEPTQKPPRPGVGTPPIV